MEAQAPHTVWPISSDGHTYGGGVFQSPCPCPPPEQRQRSSPDSWQDKEGSRLAKSQRQNISFVFLGWFPLWGSCEWLLVAWRTEEKPRSVGPQLPSRCLVASLLCSRVSSPVGRAAGCFTANLLSRLERTRILFRPGGRGLLLKMWPDTNFQPPQRVPGGDTNCVHPLLQDMVQPGQPTVTGSGG